MEISEEIRDIIKESFNKLKEFQNDNSLEDNEELNDIKNLLKKCYKKIKGCVKDKKEAEVKDSYLKDKTEPEFKEKKIDSFLKMKTEVSPNDNIKNISKIYTDGSFNKNTQPFAWGSVIDEFSNDVMLQVKETEFVKDMILKEVSTPLFKQCCVIEVKFDDVKTQQNNGAELLSMVVALRIADKYPNIKEIFSDSQLIVDYWSNPNHQLKNNKLDKNKVNFIKEAKTLRKKFEERGGKITKISGDNNKADLGYHK